MSREAAAFSVILQPVSAVPDHPHPGEKEPCQNTVLEAGQTVKVKVISIAPDGKIALSIKQTQPAPERAPRAPRSPRPQGQQGSNGGARPAGGRPPRREAAPRVWQPKPSQPQGDLSFEDMMARYKTQSEEKIADLKRVTENHRGGYSRRRG